MMLEKTTSERFHHSQSGSLITGLAFLMSCIMLSGLFALIAAHESSRYQLADKRRATLLTEASVTAQSLNRIAANNALIIVKVAEALERFSASHALATNYQRVVPFWKGRFLDRELKEQEPVAGLFAATSRNFANLFAESKALAADSQSTRSQLQSKDYRWQGAFIESSIKDVFCTSIELLSRKRNSTRLAAAQTISLTRVRFSRSQQGCSISIGTRTIFDPELLFGRGQVPGPLSFGLTLLQSSEPLEIPVTNSREPWQSNALMGNNEWPSHVELGRGAIRLMHPALHPQPQPLRQLAPRLEPMLDPKWVPVYVTQEMGG
jgi:hypothetical protein